jgi:ABC-type sugar transport system substrate-binding protein
MRRVFTMALPVVLASMASGCGDPFGAPTRSSSSSSPELAAVEPQAPKTIFMVVPSFPVNQVELWCIQAQREANTQKTIFRAMGPSEGQPSSNQPEVIRKAIADGASALIVVPGDAPELAQTLADAEAKGVSVVLLGRSIPAPTNSKPFTYIDHEAYVGLAKRIVATTIEDAKKAGRPLDGTVLLVTDQVFDQNSAVRQAALKEAVEAAGLRPVVNVSFNGSTAESAKKAVLEAVKAHPDVVIVLSDEGEGTFGASQARFSLGGEPVFFVGGFAGYRGQINDTLLANESCLVEGRVGEMATLAVHTALKKLKGEPVPERVELPATFRRGTGEIAPAVKPDSKAKAESIKKTIDDAIQSIVPTQPPPKP